MIDMGIVKGSEAQAKPLIIGKDTVYVHTDIHTVEETDERGEKFVTYEYHEVQYTLEEWNSLNKN